MESANIMQEEDDESISFEKEIYEEEDEEAIVQSKLGEEWDLPPSPSTYDSNSETKNSIVIDEHVNETYYLSDESDDDIPMDDVVSPNNDFYDYEECVLDILYDNALDDGPILHDNPPCLEIVTSLREDKNDIHAICYDTLIVTEQNL